MAPEDERSTDLLDVALRDEIELVSDLVVAASGVSRHFTQAEVDELLGIAPRPEADLARSEEHASTVRDTPAAG